MTDSRGDLTRFQTPELPKSVRNKGIIEIKVNIFYADGYVTTEAKASFIGLGKGCKSFIPSDYAQKQAINKGEIALLELLRDRKELGIA